MGARSLAVASIKIWFYTGLLAELEAETLGTELALARTD
jgi:hypothetical protein